MKKNVIFFWKVYPSILGQHFLGILVEVSVRLYVVMSGPKTQNVGYSIEKMISNFTCEPQLTWFEMLSNYSHCDKAFTDMTELIYVYVFWKLVTLVWRNNSWLRCILMTSEIKSLINECFLVKSWGGGFQKCFDIFMHKAHITCWVLQSKLL